VVFVHSYEGEDCLAIVDSQGHEWPQKLVVGADFYMQPCWHPQGDRLAWVAWQHPQMPWEGSLLQMGQVTEDANGLPHVTSVTTLAGSRTVAVFQPTFSPDGRYLAYVSNQSAWDDLYLYDLRTDTHRVVVEQQGDLGQPAWIQGMRTYGFRPDSKALYYLRNEQGFRRLWSCDLERGVTRQQHARLAPYTVLEQPAVSPTRCVLACIASAPTQPSRVVTLHLDRHTQVRVCKRSSSESVPSADLTMAQAITWKTDQGTMHGLLYRPLSTRLQGIGKPPAIVMIHGGPTSQAVATFQPSVQFFTTRGYAVLQVNHRGSTGYGRAYVEARRWLHGVTDPHPASGGIQGRYLYVWNFQSLYPRCGDAQI
jgi:dipeptidyl aminopeptidase/acylaminoacyl peptidase